MTLIERFNKYAWVGVLKELIANGFFSTTASGEFAVSATIESKPTREFIDNNVDGFTYFGSAPWGSAEADEAWSIQRQSNTAPDEFVISAKNQAWTARTAIDYNNGVA